MTARSWCGSVSCPWRPKHVTLTLHRLTICSTGLVIHNGSGPKIAAAAGPSLAWERQQLDEVPNDEQFSQIAQRNDPWRADTYSRSCGRRRHRDRLYRGRVGKDSQGDV